MELIKSRSNPKIKYACALKKAAARDSEGLLLIEGLRLCTDAALNGVPIEQCFIEQQYYREHDCGQLIEAAASTFLIDAAVADKLADTKHPQGVFCVCKKPAPVTQLDVKGKYLLLERVSDPGNLGTAVRTAEAFGLSGVILAQCCDAFSPKALRAGMGASFRFPIIETADAVALVRAAKAKGMRFFCAVVDSDAADVRVLSGADAAIAAVGNEANGLSPQLQALGKSITIHMAGRAESLNASQAATVIMYEMSK